MLKKILSTIFLLAFFCLSFQAKASHYLGGELTWRCTTGGQYIFTLKLYRDCGGVDFQRVIGNSQHIINNSGGANFSVILRQINDITPQCAGAAQLPNCSANPRPPQQSGAVEEFVYTSNPVTLPATPPAAGGWVFSQTFNARPPSVNLNGQTNFLIRASMHPYVPKGATTPLPANPCYDDSPRFLANPTSIICSDYLYNYNHLAGDKEIDSLFYSWETPRQTLNQPNTFVPGYSFDAPYPDPSENILNGPVTLDGVTGQMTVESYNPTPGNYISCVKVEAWKNCQLKAQVYRDLALVYSTDPACAGNQPPTANIDLVAFPKLKKIGNNYYASVYPGDTIAFNLTANDLGANGAGAPQTICLEASNDELGVPLSSQSGCLSGKTPCATLTPTAPLTQYCNPLNGRFSFLWVPSCAHLATESGCRGLTSTYPFALRMVDDGCPANATSVATVIIDVLKGNPDPVPFKCANVLNAAMDVELTWEQPAVDSGLYFYSYFIYADDGSGNFVPIDTIGDPTILNTTITANQMPNGITTPGSFYMVHSDTSRGGIACPFFSVPSDTLTTMDVTLTQPPGGRTDTISLTWNALRNNSNITYQIWVEVPLGSGSWKKIDETTDLFYNSFLSACDDQGIFEIRVLDTATGCFSTSTISDVGNFKDEINSDIIVIDSVTVSEITGFSNISWQPTTSLDVIEYNILFNDPNIGWNSIGTVIADNITPTVYEWPLSTPDMRSEEFRVISLDSCGNQSDDKLVVPHRTILLRDNLDKCEGTLAMSWSEYKGFLGGVGEYKLYYVETDVNGIIGPNTLAFSSEEDTIFRLNRLRSGSEYCFTVKAYDTTGFISSTSNEVCVLATVSQGSEELYVASVTNNAERGSIEIFSFIDGTADVSMYNIQRSLDEYGPWETLSTVNKPSAPPYTILFSDYGADINRNYYYRIASVDICGGNDTVSNIGTNMVVAVNSNPNLTNTVTWNPYRNWDGIVDRYDIYRSTDGGVSFSLVGTNPGADTTFDDNVSAFSDERIEFCYYVRGIEANNPLNYVNNAGQPFSSRSNEGCVFQRVKMYMPNAFRPESSVPENQTFGPSLRFNDTERYRLLVMNRWGNVVFETNDPLERWDGTQSGKDLPSGVYVYKVQFATKGDATQEESGSFTLIR